MNIGTTYNNPGNLTVGYPGTGLVGNGYLYSGQSGIYTSSNGYSYAEFPDAATGSAALNEYVQNNIGTDASNSFNTIGSFLGNFLNGNPDQLVNTQANPNAVGYANNAASSVGIGLNTPFNSNQVNSPTFIQAIAQAISQNEGTSSVYTAQNGGVASTSGSLSSGAAPTSNGGLLGAASDWINNADSYLNGAIPALNNWFSGADGQGGNAMNTTAAEANSAQAGAQASQNGIFAPLISWFNGQITGIESGVQPFLVRGGFITVGVVLLIAGIFYIVASNKQVQQVVKTAAIAA